MPNIIIKAKELLKENWQGKYMLTSRVIFTSAPKEFSTKGGKIKTAKNAVSFYLFKFAPQTYYQLHILTSPRMCVKN